MFFDEDLINHLQSNNSVKLNSLVIAEFNQNVLTNIQDYGNYRWRTNTASSAYSTLMSTYDEDDVANAYSNALESTRISKYRTDNPNEPLIFETKETERQLQYSLRECFTPFRPRSGINKILFFNGKFVDSIRSGRRPRYYFSSRKDQFKYWTSFRKEDGSNYGISSSGSVSSGYKIEDAVPFLIYKNEVVANRIVVKMQTNLADSDVIGIDGEAVANGQIRVNNSIITDPLQNLAKSSIPKKWKIQYLDSDNNWNDAISFDKNSLRRDGSRIVPWDGYVELSYGIKIPEEYRDSFNFIDYVSSSVQLPLNVVNGQSYIVGSSESSSGDLYIWDTLSQQWVVSEAEYGFSLLEDNDTKRIGLVKKIVDPEYFVNNSVTTFREFAVIKGLRVAVETMYAPNQTFDLIEISPRLKVDLTEQVIEFNINKNIAATDYGLPVGGLAAGAGNLNVSNYNGAFTELNIFDKESKTGSIIADILRPQVKFDFYETILDVSGYDKFVPLKTLYSENATTATSGMNDVEINLRDAFFRLESANAVQTLIRNSTLTKAVAILLDNIGFSNYVFKGISTANDPIIPFFFVEPDISVAEVLQRLAQSTQTAMFFDEYNNFVIMPKEYMMPDISISDSNSSISDRLITLYGQKSGSIVPNIENIGSSETKVINDGKINYTTRYIQRDLPLLEQASYDSRDRSYVYKSSVLWQLGDQERNKVTNGASDTSAYALGAVSLNSDLSSTVPYVENHIIKNNIIDIGADSVVWLQRFQGYLYANGEIIRYDAQEFSVSGSGNVWISSNQEYQKYFSKLPFNGQIWSTGRLRIFVEPFYEETTGTNNEGLQPGVSYKNGEVKSHGRGQFGTQVVSHTAGLNPYWKDGTYKKSFRMDSKYIFDQKPTDLISYPRLSSVLTSPIGEDTYSKGKSEVSDKIVNYLRKNIRSEYNSSTANQTDATVQSSALILTGPQTFTPVAPSLNSTSQKDVVSYVYKDFTNDYKHVGTRIRIIGKPGGKENPQSPLNASPYFNTTNSVSGTSQISGSSGGIGYMIDKNTNSGYYFEIAALNEDTLSYYENSASVSSNFASAEQVLHNVIFYKVLNKTTETAEPGKENIAIPVKLWGTRAKILVDGGNFVGMDRLISQENPTVFDLAVEHQVVGNSVIFYLYLNNALVATVTDSNPLPNVTTNSTFAASLFVRAGSKCMFENFYALKNKASQSESITATTSQQGNQNSLISIFGNNQINVAESLRKYAMSGIVQSTYLSSIGTDAPPGYDMYFEEFGTIMRECAYFNIKYDQAYPALVAKFLPVLTPEKSYVISGFKPGSYGAEFLIFNSTDKFCVLDQSSSSPIIIYGVTFTQNISNVLTVDDYFKQVSNLSDPLILSTNQDSPASIQKVYDDIKTSRSIYGNKSFTLDSVYVQDEDSANSLMAWIVDKTLRPRKVIEVDAFAVPHIQLGDIVKINYDLPEGVKMVDENKRFVVISTNYSRSNSNVLSQLRLIEV